MKHLIAAVALSFALFGPALAGEIPSGGYTAPPPPPSANGQIATLEVEATEDIPTSGFAQQVSDDAVIGVILAMVAMF